MFDECTVCHNGVIGTKQKKLKQPLTLQQVFILFNQAERYNGSSDYLKVIYYLHLRHGEYYFLTHKLKKSLAHKFYSTLMHSTLYYKSI